MRIIRLAIRNRPDRPIEIAALLGNCRGMGGRLAKTRLDGCGFFLGRGTSRAKAGLDAASIILLQAPR